VYELLEVQGDPVELGGYYRPDPRRVVQAMRPSRTFNEALEDF
jgi:isocitrate dehydrogenase